MIVTTTKGSLEIEYHIRTNSVAQIIEHSRSFYLKNLLSFLYTTDNFIRSCGNGFMRRPCPQYFYLQQYSFVCRYNIRTLFLQTLINKMYNVTQNVVPQLANMTFTDIITFAVIHPDSCDWSTNRIWTGTSDNITYEMIGTARNKQTKSCCKNQV